MFTQPVMLLSPRHSRSISRVFLLFEKYLHHLFLGSRLFANDSSSHFGTMYVDTALYLSLHHRRVLARPIRYNPSLITSLSRLSHAYVPPKRTSHRSLLYIEYSFFFFFFQRNSGLP